MTLFSLFIFNCDTDGYLVSTPYFPCSGVLYQTMTYIFYAAVPIYVISIPAIIGYTIYKRYNDYLIDPNVKLWIGSFMEPFKSKKIPIIQNTRYWAGILLGRKLIIAIIIISLQQDTGLLLWVLFIILGGYLFIQLKYRPYNGHIENQFERTSLTLLVFSCFSSLLVTSFSSDGKVGTNIIAVNIVIAAVNFVFVFTIILAIVFKARHKVFDFVKRKTPRIYEQFKLGFYRITKNKLQKLFDYLDDYLVKEENAYDEIIQMKNIQEYSEQRIESLLNLVEYQTKLSNASAGAKSNVIEIEPKRTSFLEVPK